MVNFISRLAAVDDTASADARYIRNPLQSGAILAYGAVSITREGNSTTTAWEIEGNGGENGATSDSALRRRKKITYSSQGLVSYLNIPKIRHPYPKSRRQLTQPDIGISGPRILVVVHHAWDSGWGKRSSFHIFRYTPCWASCKRTDSGYSWGTECTYPRN